jgi:toxin HigB-1
MIKTYADKETQKLAETGRSKKIPVAIHKRAITRLAWLDTAQTVDDLLIPPSNNIEKLSGNREGQYSIRINNQWRVCFRFENGHVYDVEIVDYH